MFRVMQCTEVQKVRFGTHMLAEEADDWWVSLLPILEQDGAEVTWAVFKREFLDRYFPEDVRGKKEIEFLELKQGNMLVTEYAAKCNTPFSQHKNFSKINNQSKLNEASHFTNISNMNK